MSGSQLLDTLRNKDFEKKVAENKKQENDNKNAVRVVVNMIE